MVGEFLRTIRSLVAYKLDEVKLFRIPLLTADDGRNPSSTLSVTNSTAPD
jgi:hypothetical protein